MDRREVLRDGVTDAPATVIRRNTSAEIEGQTEKLIRLANELLMFWGIGMSHSRVVKHVRRFTREVIGFTFFDYFSNAVQVDDQQRRGARLDRDRARRITYVDPTGETAGWHVGRRTTVDATIPTRDGRE